VLFAVVQILLLRDLPLGWDESVYASQLDPRSPALEFSAPRARGMSFISAPMQAVTGSLVALRVWLALLAAAALYLAYAVWLRIPGSGTVPLAALLFITPWTTIFYGPTTMPNVAVALAGVAAAGCLLRRVRGEQGWRTWWGIAGTAAVVTLIRPGDVAPLAAGLGLVVLGHPRWRRSAVQLLLPVALGAGAGALPWLVEAQLRYGGIIPRVHRALGAQGTGERFVPDYQLRSLDGPILCRPCVRADQPIPLSGLLWWLAGAALVAVALWVVRNRVSRADVWVPTVVGATAALPYLFLVGYAAPRFLLPAYALLALPAARGLGALVTSRGGSVRVLPAVLAATLLVAHVVAQLRILDHLMESHRAGREAWVGVAEALAARGVRPPCTFAGGIATPVAYVAGCDSVRVARLPGEEDFSVADLRARATREPVALLLPRGSELPDYARGWEQVPPADLPRRGGIRVWIAPENWGTQAQG
jgi:hypothetical protein